LVIIKKKFGPLSQENYVQLFVIKPLVMTVISKKIQKPTLNVGFILQ
jgi:hypothetical protein